MTRLVRVGAAAGILLALLVAISVRASSDAADAPSFDPQSNRFALAVVPDTQYLFDDQRGDSEPVAAAFKWIINNRAAENIAFVAGVGDVTESGQQNEVDRASAAYKILDDAKIPFSSPTGNHDVNSNTDDTRGPTPFSQAFSTERYAKMPTFVSASPGQGYSTAHRFTAAGRQWLVLALDWRMSETGIAWAQSVLDANKKVPTIVTTHDMVAGNTGNLTSNGQRMWDRLIKGNDQVILGMGGHNWPVSRSVRQNDFGHDVHFTLNDYQDMYYGGAGTIRTYTFDIDRNAIDVETFSPWVMGQAEKDRSPLERQMLERTDAQSRFSLNVDFKALAQRLDPQPEPAEVSTDALKVPGTVALWRPSGTGAVTGLSDLSGNGNDLTPVTVGGTGAQTEVSVSDDHATDQPSRKSLKFAGERRPARGTYLRTPDNAPLNTNEFKNGYTFEAFVKLPANCCGGHDWMGILGQMGTGRDIGRTQSDPDEGSIVLGLSGGAQLQWAVWPTNRGDIVTNWGHEDRPTDKWMHVAVVNDGRYSDLYMNGSLLGRNPFQVANGLGSTGKYWMLGATNYGNVVEQTFNGLIGDVRLVDRALPASRFMNAVRNPRIDATATAATLNNTERAIDVAIEGTATGTAAVKVIEPRTGDRFDLGTAPIAANARFKLTAAQYRVLQDGARVEVTLNDSERGTLHLRAEGKLPDAPPDTVVDTPAPVGGEVPATLALTLGAQPSFGAFTPGVEREYTASTTATVISSAADAALTVADPSTTAAGHLVNGTRSLAQPLEAKARDAAYGPLGTLLTYSEPVANDAVAISFRQKIGANEPLRTGAYAKTLTFTLSTTAP